MRGCGQPRSCKDRNLGIGRCPSAWIRKIVPLECACRGVTNGSTHHRCGGFIAESTNDFSYMMRIILKDLIESLFREGSRSTSRLFKMRIIECYFLIGQEGLGDFSSFNCARYALTIGKIHTWDARVSAAGYSRLSGGLRGSHPKLDQRLILPIVRRASRVPQ